MQTLIPAPITATARPLTRVKRFLGFGLTTRTLLLLVAGLFFAWPAFYHPRRIWIMLAWDALILLLAAFDLLRLPAPAQFTVSRRFLDSPRLGERTGVELEVTQASNTVVSVTVTDALEASMLPMPKPLTAVAYPRDPVRVLLECFPGRRGDLRLGNIFLRYTGALRLVERWAVADAAQQVQVFPAMQESGSDASLYLIRARQIELQKRRLRMRGIGREFESLREYQNGDEVRNISWTATARRSRLITRQYTMERSQQVWMVLDAGRLSRTAFELRRHGAADDQQPASEQERAESLQLTVTQLDQAATAAVMLAEAVGHSGDKFGLLTYGRGVQQMLLPGAGPAHLRVLIDQLSHVRCEAAEANHLMAAMRLKEKQRRRSLVVWVTEIGDSAGRPEIVSAAASLARRHLVLLVLLQHAELDKLATAPVSTVETMYVSAAAQEILARRRSTIAALRQIGVLVVESSPSEIGMQAINSYLAVKSKGSI